MKSNMKEINVKRISINAYKKQYEKLASQCSPFQRYSCIKSACNVFYAIRFQSYTKHYAVFCGNTPMMFASFRFYFGSSQCAVIGTQECFDLVDFVYDFSMSNDELIKCFCAMIEHIRDVEKKTIILFDWLPSDTKTKPLLELLCNNRIIKYRFESINNVKIPISEFQSFDEYFKSLSKSVRQNIRTAYNRVARDNHIIKLNVFFGKEIPHSVAKKGCKLYLRGQKERFNHSGLSYRFHFRYIHYVSRTMFEDYSFHASLMLDGEPVAMMQGYFDEKRRDIQIPRLAIDPKFNFYSPGYIMICELIKELYTNSRIKSLDLMRGSEKYKLDLGGVFYNTYKCMIEIM